MQQLCNNVKLQLVWRKGNIEKTFSVLQYCVLLQWCTKVRAVLTGWSTVSGFDLAWFSSVSYKHFCVFGVHGGIYVLICFAYVLLFTF